MITATENIPMAELANNFCIWITESAEDKVYLSGCTKRIECIEGEIQDYKYCPYCGRQLLLVEDRNETI